MGGHSNWLLAPEFDFLIDAGEGVASTIGIGRLNACRNIFLTHGHWDHTAGLIQALNLRRRQAQDGTLTVWHPPGRKFDTIRKMIGNGVKWEVFSEGQAVEVSKNIYLQPFGVEHRGAAAFGFHCMEKRTRKKAEFAHLDAPQISALVAATRRDGGRPPEISEPYSAHLFAYTGDTEPLDPRRLGHPEILFHDATYLPGMEAEAIASGHSCLSHACKAQEDCGAGVLVALHLSPRHAGQIPPSTKGMLLPEPRLGAIQFEANGSGYQLSRGGQRLVPGQSISRAGEVKKGVRRRGVNANEGRVLDRQARSG